MYGIKSISENLTAYPKRKKENTYIGTFLSIKHFMSPLSKLLPGNSTVHASWVILLIEEIDFIHVANVLVSQEQLAIN